MGAGLFADRFIPEAEKARAGEAGDDARTILFLERFSGFNDARFLLVGHDGNARPLGATQR